MLHIILVLLHNSCLYHEVYGPEDEGHVGGGAHRMRTSHTYDLPGAPSTDISPLPMEDTHIRHVEVPSTSSVVPLVTSSPQPLEAMSNAEESVPIANVDQERQDDDQGRGHGDVGGDMVVMSMRGFTLVP